METLMGRPADHGCVVQLELAGTGAISALAKRLQCEPVIAEDQ
jgi:hypothetical protein